MLSSTAHGRVVYYAFSLSTNFAPPLLSLKKISRSCHINKLTRIVKSGHSGCDWALFMLSTPMLPGWVPT